MRTHALLHVLAFIRGHSGTKTIDFQTVLPTLLAVLLHAQSDKRDRALIFEIISLLGDDSEKKRMYGLDTPYVRLHVSPPIVHGKDHSRVCISPATVR